MILSENGIKSINVSNPRVKGYYILLFLQIMLVDLQKYE